MRILVLYYSLFNDVMLIMSNLLFLMLTLFFTAHRKYFFQVMLMTYLFTIVALLTDVIVLTLLTRIFYVIKLKLADITFFAFLLETCRLLFNYLLKMSFHKLH